jgi:hypothetical protein
MRFERRPAVRAMATKSAPLWAFFACNGFGAVFLFGTLAG